MSKKSMPSVNSKASALAPARSTVARVAKLLGAAALNNVVALVALGVAIVSLSVSLADRREARNRELLATTMMSEVVGESHAAIEFPAHTLSPFDPPYLMLPVRLFVMNRSSLPQTVVGIWVTFDEGPEDKLRYMTLDQVRETNGAQLAWPKTIPQWGATGFDVTVPIPIAAELANILGVSPDNPGPRDLGPAGRLFFTLGERSTQYMDVYQRLRRQIRFDLRLLSASPGSPTHLTYSVSLP